LCDPHIPDGAVVTRLRVTVSDFDSFYAIYGCALARADLAAATAGHYDVIASVPGTGAVAAPGIFRLTSTAIAAATVDHTRFGYWIQCQLAPYGEKVGIYGADVRYTISTTN
jgi:hypothetical protein